MQNKQFDNYLNIDIKKIQRYKFIVFTGESGSGKSTYIKNTIGALESKATYIFTEGEYSKPSVLNEIVVIEELRKLSDIRYIFQYLFSHKRIFIASHLSVIFLWFLYLFGETKFYSTDKNIQKIKNYLRSHGYSFSNDVLKKYVKKYKATYTDLEIILEVYPDMKDFDVIYDVFHDNCSISMISNY